MPTTVPAIFSTTSNTVDAANRSGLDHRIVWRWHFYAGLFCIPFVLWLSVTGTIFLFHPQIQQIAHNSEQFLVLLR